MEDPVRILLGFIPNDTRIVKHESCSISNIWCIVTPPEVPFASSSLDYYECWLHFYDSKSTSCNKYCCWTTGTLVLRVWRKGGGWKIMGGGGGKSINQHTLSLHACTLKSNTILCIHTLVFPHNPVQEPLLILFICYIR